MTSQNARPATIREALAQIKLHNLPRELQPQPEHSTDSGNLNFLRLLPQGVPPETALEKVNPELLQAIREAFAAGQFPVFIFGPVGCGKTCAAACVYRSWRVSENRIGTVRWRRCDTLLDEILKARFSDGVAVETPGGDMVKMTESGLFGMFSTADMAVLDDIGTSRLNEERYPALLRLLDSRVGKPTIITSNKSPRELEAVCDYRIVSRVTAGMTLKVAGDDRRIEGSGFRSIA